MSNTAAVQIDKVKTETIIVSVIGTAPLIVHRFSDKAKRIMLDGMQGQKALKQAKDPVAEYKGAFYRFKGGGYGLPALSFKSATVGGCRFYGKSISMTAARQLVFFKGEPGEDGQMLVPIIGEPEMREDVVTVGQGGHDLRYRPQFNEWRSILTITYVTSLLTRGSMLSLVDAGGMGCGVGEWRPERRGDFGTYQIDTTREVEVLS